MASRQQRRQSDRDICRDTYIPGEWWQQEKDVDVVVRALGANTVRSKARGGNANALYALGAMTNSGLDRRLTGGVEDALYADKRWREEYDNEGFEALMKASEKGHVYAEEFMADIFRCASDHLEMCRMIYRKCAERGLPSGMFKYARNLESGEGGLEIDAPAAAEWYRKAAGHGHGGAAVNLSLMRECGRGVLRSKQFAFNAMRKAAENRNASACAVLAKAMFLDNPYARSVGRIKREDFEHTDSSDDYTNTDSILNHMAQQMSETDNENGSILPSIVEWLRRCEAAGGETMDNNFHPFRLNAYVTMLDGLRSLASTEVLWGQ
jgi:TPR repeat protein